MILSAKRRAHNAAQRKYKASKKGQRVQRKYYKSEAKSQSNRRWAQKNRWKSIAHNIVRSAIKNAKLLRQPCQRCGKPNAFAHHDDYSKPLEVKWFCNYHHCEYHNWMKFRNVQTDRR